MRPKRLMLVMAAERPALGALTGLREAAKQIGRALCDEWRGCCEPMKISGADNGVLLNPDAATIGTAIEAASSQIDGALVILVWIGHGTAERDKFLLVPYANDSMHGAPAGPVTSGVELSGLLQRLKDGSPEALILLLDACHSGVATDTALRPWIEQAGADAALSILTATRNQAAWDLSFTRGITSLLEGGVGDLSGEHLTVQELNQRINELADCQTSTLLLHNKARLSTMAWVGQNVAFKRRSHSMLVEHRLEELVATPAVLTVVRWLVQESKSFTLVGDAGVGKTTLAEMLVRMPKPLREASERQNLIDASIFATATTTYSTVFRALADQLKLDAAFSLQAEAFSNRDDLPSDSRDLIVPLECWLAERPANAAPITILIDSLDSIETAARQHVFSLLKRLQGINREGVPQIRVVALARSGTNEDNDMREARTLDAMQEADARAYLEHRHIPFELHDVMVNRIRGNWLCAKEFADYATVKQNQVSAKIQNLTLRVAFEERLERLKIGAELDGTQQTSQTIVFAALAVAGAGPILPFSLLRSASALLGGAKSEVELRSILAELGGWTASAAANSPDETLGLFHQELVTYAQGKHSLQDVLRQAREGIVRALDEGYNELTTYKPLWNYAVNKWAEHLFELGRYDEIVKTLSRTWVLDPNEALRRLEMWFTRLSEVLVESHEDMFTLRRSISSATGSAGDHGQALELAEKVLRDQEQVMDKDHPDLMAARYLVASEIEWAKNADKALEVFSDLLPHAERIDGKESRQAFHTRFKIAECTFRLGGVSSSLELYQALLADQLRVFDRNDVSIKRTRVAIAGILRDASLFWEMHEEQLSKMERDLGKDHIFVLQQRTSNAFQMANSGYANWAVEFFRTLLPDLERALGKDDQFVQLTRARIAGLVSLAKDRDAAIHRYMSGDGHDSE